MRDRIVVTVEPSRPSDRLDISEAFQQVIDYLRLVELAASDKARFEWKLEKASTNSPFTVVAYTPVGASATKSQQSLEVAQQRTEDGIKELARGSVPKWMRRDQRSAARRLTRRFNGSIGRMAFRTDEHHGNSFTVTSHLANRALRTLDRADGIEDLKIPAHTAYGEIEGTLEGVGTYQGKPALWVRAVGYQVVRCLVDGSKLEVLGDEATLREVWQHKRIRIQGRLYFQEGGDLGEVVIDEMHLFPSPAVSLSQVIESSFLSDFEPVAYLDRLHEGMTH